MTTHPSLSVWPQTGRHSPHLVLDLNQPNDSYVIDNTDKEGSARNTLNLHNVSSKQGQF